MSDNTLTGSDLKQALTRAVTKRDESLRLAAVNGSNLLTLARFTNSETVPPELEPEAQVDSILSGLGEGDAGEIARLRNLLNQVFAESEHSHG